MSLDLPPTLLAGALAALLLVASIPAAIQLCRAMRAGDRARTGKHGVQLVGALGAAAVLLLWWRR